MFTFFLWIHALKTGSAFWAALTAFFYFYMVAAWGTHLFYSPTKFRWIRLYYQYVTITRLHPHSHGSILFPSLRRILNVLCPWNTRINANSLRWIHASTYLRTHGRPRFPSTPLSTSLIFRNIRSTPINCIHAIRPISSSLKNFRITYSSLYNQYLFHFLRSTSSPHINRNNSPMDRKILFPMGYRIC